MRRCQISTAEGRRCAHRGETTYHRWRNEFGGLEVDEVKRLKELEAENVRLPPVAELTLDEVILTEAAKGNF